MPSSAGAGSLTGSGGADFFARGLACGTLKSRTVGSGTGCISAPNPLRSGEAFSVRHHCDPLPLGAFSPASANRAPCVRAATSSDFAASLPSSATSHIGTRPIAQMKIREKKHADQNQSGINNRGADRTEQRESQMIKPDAIRKYSPDHPPALWRANTVDGSSPSPPADPMRSNNPVNRDEQYQHPNAATTNAVPPDNQEIKQVGRAKNRQQQWQKISHHAENRKIHQAKYAPSGPIQL